jgi:hypothetical protein
VSEDVSVERLSVGEAARVLGVTRDAIHKRISRGTINHEKGEDSRFYVYVDTSTEGLDSSTDTSKDESKVETLERLLEHQQERISFLERVLEEERQTRTEERRRHDTLMAQLVQRIPELEPPREARESPTAPPDYYQDPTDAGGGTQEPAEALGGPSSGTARGSWWRRMLGG